MIYELRHFNTPLLQFTATEDSSSPDIKIVWINEEKQKLLPLGLALSGASLSRYFYTLYYAHHSRYNKNLKIFIF